jgi:glycosyltransferase involved in cell wall biosynthesis
MHGRFDVVIEEAVGGERAPFLARLFAGGPTLPFWYQDNRPLFNQNYGIVGAKAGAVLQQVLLWANRSGYALANSNATRDWLVSEGVGASRIGVSYPKVNPDFAPAKPLPFEQRRNRMITVGNFRPTKRFEESLHVFSRLIADHPDAELILLGRPQDERYLTSLHHLADTLGVGPRVTFRLGVPEKDKFDILSTAKVLTIHSPVEGFGWSITEAGLCGVPTVGNPGVPSDTLREGVNGIRVPFGAVGDYVREVGRLFSDQAWWNSLSNGARKVSREFAFAPVESQVRSVLFQCAGLDGGDPTLRSKQPASV